MRTTRIYASRLLFLLLLTATLDSCAQAQIIIIANPGIHAPEVSRAALRDVFTGASSTLKDGSIVSPVLLKQGTVHEEMLTLYIGKSDSAFRAGWRSLLFSGQGTLPRSLDSDAAVVEYVAHTPGAIGYISHTAPHDGVKTIVVR
jgi:ABC-type phosphate transport system substrate-binding protein